MEMKCLVFMLIIGFIVVNGVTSNSTRGCNRMRCRRICPGSLFQVSANGCITCRCCYPGASCVNTRPVLKDFPGLSLSR